MKVLMFGWEFPPHISGGLGTACHGLTNSLSKQNIDVLFVVPKLHGEESADRTNFINASSIPIDASSGLDQYIGSSRNPDVRDSLYKVLHKEGVTQIEVPSTLSPYRALQFGQQSRGIEHWNYGLEEKGEVNDNKRQKKTRSNDRGAAVAPEKKKKDSTAERVLASYKFSG